MQRSVAMPPIAPSRGLPPAKFALLSLTCALWATACGSASAAGEAIGWKRLGAGVDYATFLLDENPIAGDGVLHVVRVDADLADVVAVLASEQGVPPRTAGSWSERNGLLVAMNLGMYETDGRTNVGYLRNGPHLNNGRWKKTYNSALGFGRADGGVPRARFVDLDTDAGTAPLAEFPSVVQNLRLIRAPGQNVWAENDKRWSEAALGADARGRLYLLFCRSPYSMVEFNKKVLGLPLGIVRAMHVEGGPEASLSIHAPGMTLDLAGSYETGVNPTNANPRQWPIPNVLGVRARPQVRLP